MCWMCDRYGDGKRQWFLNPELFARNMYKLRDPGEKTASFGQIGGAAKRVIEQTEVVRIRDDEPEKFAEALRLYNEDNLNFTADQAITLQEAFQIADIGAPMASMMCICRQMDRASDERNPMEYSCLGAGPGMFKWERWPERYKGGVHFMPPDEVKEWLTKWNKRGFMHTIMTAHGMPYIEGICNCEYPACWAIRDRLDIGITKLLKGHFVAQLDYDKCNGCGICVQRCQFGACKFEVRIDKTNIDLMRCFGCGLCQTGCPREAITMVERARLPGVKEIW